MKYFKRRKGLKNKVVSIACCGIFLVFFSSIVYAAFSKQDAAAKIMGFYNGQGRVIAVSEDNINGRWYFGVVYINIQGWQQIHLVDRDTGQIAR